MWTPATRAELARESQPYPTSLSDAEWAVLAPLLPAPSNTGRPWRRPLRAVFDGILCALRTGCAWRHLPLDFPPWSTVHPWFLRLSQAGVFERLAHTVTMADRERVGREACPTGCVVDAQAARSGGVGVAGERDDDPARRVVGRKRHALTNTDARLLVAAVSPADLHDSHGAIALRHASRGLFPFPAHCFADRAIEASALARPRPSRSRSWNPRRARRALRCSPGGGSSSGASAGSPAAAGWLATTKPLRPLRSPSSSSPQP